MQVLRLNDLKRMKITELSHMAQDFGVEGTQGLKKQDLIFALLSGIADKKFEVHAEGVMELLSPTASGSSAARTATTSPARTTST